MAAKVVSVAVAGITGRLEIGDVVLRTKPCKANLGHRLLCVRRIGEEKPIWIEVTESQYRDAMAVLIKSEDGLL